MKIIITIGSNVSTNLRYLKFIYFRFKGYDPEFVVQRDDQRGDQQQQDPPPTLPDEFAVRARLSRLHHNQFNCQRSQADTFNRPWRSCGPGRYLWDQYGTRRAHWGTHSGQFGSSKGRRCWRDRSRSKWLWIGSTSRTEKEIRPQPIPTFLKKKNCFPFFNIIYIIISVLIIFNPVF